MSDVATLARTSVTALPSNPMLELARLTDKLKQAIPAGARVGYVDYPMHMNVGDLLIYLGALDFFRANGNRIGRSFCVFDASPRAIASLADCDVIVCHGGGNFGDIYGRHQRLREEIVRSHPGKPIVVMPQSFHFASAGALTDSAAIFRLHPNVTIAVRDQDSYATARSQFSDQVMLVPDMAHRLYDGFDSIRRHGVVQESSPLRLMRRDIEVNAAIPAANAVDWADLLRPTEIAHVGVYRLASIASGRLNLPSSLIMPAHGRAVAPIIDRLARRLIVHGDWITSRLHGAIFGLLLDRRVELFDNSYGKNSRYFHQWGAELKTLTIL